MSLLDKFDELEEEQEEIKETKPTPPTNLHPPKESTKPKETKPKTPKKQTPTKTERFDDIDINMDEIIDYVDNVLMNEATHGDIKRATYLRITGSPWRGTNDNLNKALYKYYKERDEFKIFKKEATKIVREFKKTKPNEIKGRGTHRDFGKVIEELKTVLDERKKKLNL